MRVSRSLGLGFFCGQGRASAQVVVSVLGLLPKVSRLLRVNLLPRGHVTVKSLCIDAFGGRQHSRSLGT